MIDARKPAVDTSTPPANEPRKLDLDVIARLLVAIAAVIVFLLRWIYG